MNQYDVLNLFTQFGLKQYANEAVNQLEHGWQCSQLAKNAGANESLQLAAFLHDVGHLIVGMPGSPTLLGIDDEHEFVGANALTKIWGATVSEPVKLHVLAKRYLVTAKPEYANKLSADSVRSLKIQGGLMSEAEIAAFHNEPYGEQAILIRVWDDLAKSSEATKNISIERQLEDLTNLIHLTPLATDASHPKTNV